MNKIREIIEEYANSYGVIPPEDFDKLEKDLLKYCDNQVLIAIVNLAYDEKMEITIKHIKE